MPLGVTQSAASVDHPSDEQQRRAFREAITHLRRRIELFVSLPLDKLDRLSLQERLTEIASQ